VRQFQCAGDFNEADLGGSRVLFIKDTPSKFTLLISFSFLRQPYCSCRREFSIRRSIPIRVDYYS
jgi:hypothetical protein